MARYVRFFLVIAGMVLTAVIAFAIYAHFLVDYSLENLEYTVQVTQKRYGVQNPASQRLYQSMIQDLVLEEAAQKNVDFKNLTLLELASRTLDGAVEKDDLQAVNLYLTKAAGAKAAQRNRILRIADVLYRLFLRISEAVRSMGHYIRELLGKKKGPEPVELSSVLILSQADEKERKGELDEAAELYRKFIANYPEHPDRPFVIISLAHLLIKQQKFPEAERLLLDIQEKYAGLEVSQFARSLLKKIDLFRQRKEKIQQIKTQIQSTAEKSKRENLKLQLALEHLYSYAIQDAQEVFRELEEAEDDNVRRKSKFYLAWIYKNHAQFDEGAQVLMDLIESEGADRGFLPEVTAQLADIYYRKGDVKKAKSAYDRLTAAEGKGFMEKDVARETLRALSDYDTVGGKEKNKGVEDAAFEALRQGQLDLAMRLFEKNIRFYPNDGRAYAGIATVHLLLGDIRQAYVFARRGYQFSLQDPYPPAVLAYVYGFARAPRRAVQFYGESLKRYAKYSGARYNLACSYLAVGDAEHALTGLSLMDFSAVDVSDRLRAKAFNNLGYALWYMGSRDQARQRFADALKIFPGFPDAEENLRRVGSGVGTGDIPASADSGSRARVNKK